MTISPYENPSLSAEERAADLLRQLTLNEKVGLMFHTLAEVKAPDVPNSFVPSLGCLKDLIARGITHFNLLFGGPDAAETAAIINSWQEVALAQRSKIPITVSTDPRHAFSTNVLASMSSECFSKWPEQLGMIALRSPERMREYCDIVRQEYIALGIRAALHPQVDLATSSVIVVPCREMTDRQVPVVPYLRWLWRGRRPGQRSHHGLCSRSPRRSARP